MKEVPIIATLFPAAAAATSLASSGVRTTKMPLRSAPGFDSCRGLFRLMNHRSKVLQLNLSNAYLHI